MAKETGSQLQIQVNEAYIDGVYERLSQMRVDLDQDPLAYGPKRLNEKTAQVRAFLAKSEKIFTQIAGDLALLKRELRKNQAMQKLQYDDLLANDDEVRRGQSQAVRDAIIGTKLRPLLEEIGTLEGSIAELEAVLVVVKAKRADLRDTRSALKDQLKLCQEELSLGSAWGRKKAPPLEPGVPYGGDEITALTSEVDGEIHLADQRDTSGSVSVLAPTTTEDEIEEFLIAAADSIGDEFDGLFGIPPKK